MPFLVNAVSYGLSAAGLSRIRTPLQEPRSQRGTGSLLAEIGEGTGFVARSSFLRAVVLVAAPLNFALSGAIFAAVVALQHAHASPGVIGLAQACVGAGGLLGALFAARLIRALPMRRLVAAICTALVLACLAAAGLNGRFVMILPLALGFFLAPAGNAALFARLGSTTPDLLLSRVISVIVLAATASAALAPGASGMLAEITGTTVAPLLVCAALPGLALLVALTAPGLAEESRG